MGGWDGGGGKVGEYGEPGMMWLMEGGGGGMGDGMIQLIFEGSK